MPLAELAEARSTPRATESVEASEEAQPAQFSSQPRSAAPSPSPIADIRAAEEPTRVSVALAAPRPSMAAKEISFAAAVQSAMQQFLGIVEGARHLRPAVGLPDLLCLEEAPRDRRGRPVRKHFVPVLWGGVRRSSFHAVRLGKTPRH